MTIYFRTVIHIFLLLRLSCISAQQAVSSYEDVYGSDPLLFNGRIYTFFPPLNTVGNQYLSDNRFEPGSVTIRGINFPSLMLNYDIYNQHLVLQYKNNLGAENLIILSKAWLETFSIKDKIFELVSINDTLRRIFQVIGTGPGRVLYYWTKDLKLDSFYGSGKHAFSVARKEMNLVNGITILKYRNNKSFVNLFGLLSRTTLKEYLKKHKINVRKASDQKIAELVNYCKTLQVE